ncbi:MAG: HAMP domain-containing sensor histidine kinase [archaeon]|nr:HAMP domain-containing sensor histidine kinase [archaeon]
MSENDDIKLLKEENEKLKKLSSVKTDLVSISAHQVRTSLSAFIWIFKMFLDGDLGKLTSEQDTLLRKAFEGNERAINVISELLLVNKTENIQEKEYEFSDLNIAEMIESCIFDFSGEAHAEGNEIIFLKQGEEHPIVWADKEKIRVVFQNLLENSIKYSNPHGKIFILLKENEVEIEISIKDTGIGISEDGKKKIFEKFYRDPGAQKKEVIGSGIGLFTSKQIVEKHNGKIWFESKENEGTTFFFTLPISKDGK